MKFQTLLSLSALFLALTSSEAAVNPGGGIWTNVTVTAVTVCTSGRCPPKGWVTVQLSATATGNPPSCSSDNRNQIAVDTSEATGAFAAAALQQTAMLAEPVNLTGTGKCSVDAAIETLGSVTVVSRNR